MDAGNGREVWISFLSDSTTAWNLNFKFSIEKGACLATPIYILKSSEIVPLKMKRSSRLKV